jgi:PAS domain-containing protein
LAKIVFCSPAQQLEELPAQASRGVERQAVDKFRFDQFEPARGCNVEVQQRRLQRALSEQSDIDPMEAIVRCKDGSTRYIEFHFASLGDTSLVSFVDLTDRQRAELERRESEERFRLVANTAPY